MAPLWRLKRQSTTALSSVCHGHLRTIATSAALALPVCAGVRGVTRKIAEASGGCLRPAQLRRTETQTGETVSVMVPCGVTLASICPPCAERAKALRAAQCREGWHLEDEPDLSPAAPMRCRSSG
jgi:Replication initiator protein, pSAM2